MTSADRQTKADELIDQSERLRAQLLESIERLDIFVMALDEEVARRQEDRRGTP